MFTVSWKETIAKKFCKSRINRFFTWSQSNHLCRKPLVIESMQSCVTKRLFSLRLILLIIYLSELVDWRLCVKRYLQWSPSKLSSCDTRKLSRIMDQAVMSDIAQCHYKAHQKNKWVWNFFLHIQLNNCMYKYIIIYNI